MTGIRSILASAFAFSALTACAAGDLTSPSQDVLQARDGSGGTVGTAVALARVKCDARSGRSTISVDGKNLVPLNGTWSAKVASGAMTAAAGLKRGVGDEVEFDFSSQPNDIAAGATAIARTFITVNASAPDVTASILDAAGNVVASGSADCRTR